MNIVIILVILTSLGGVSDARARKQILKLKDTKS